MQSRVVVPEEAFQTTYNELQILKQCWGQGINK